MSEAAHALFETGKKREAQEIFGVIPRPAELLKLRPLLIWQQENFWFSVTNRQQQPSVSAATHA